MKKSLKDYPRPSLTSDVVLFTIQGHMLHTLLIKRGQAPMAGAWALPGGFLRENETAISAAQRELKEETNVDVNISALTLSGVYDTAGRDPRGWVITVAFSSVLSSDKMELVGASDAADARWFPVDAEGRIAAEGIKLAFDHADIIRDARGKLRDQFTTDDVRDTKAAFDFLEDEFTLPELQAVFETILGRGVDKRNFRKWLNARYNLVELDRFRQGGRHRPARLHRLAET